MFIATATATCSLGHGLRRTALPRSTQPRTASGSLNGVPASAGVTRGGIVTSAGWQVALCDPTRHVSSHSAKARLLSKGEPLYLVYLLYMYF